LYYYNYYLDFDKALGPDNALGLGDQSNMEHQIKLHFLVKNILAGSEKE
jgi:hypothetical protein